MVGHDTLHLYFEVKLSFSRGGEGVFVPQFDNAVNFERLDLFRFDPRLGRKRDNHCKNSPMLVNWRMEFPRTWRIVL